MRGDDGPTLAPLVSETTSRLGIDTMPVEQGDLPLFDELLFWEADNPNVRRRCRQPTKRARY